MSVNSRARSQLRAVSTWVGEYVSRAGSVHLLAYARTQLLTHTNVGIGQFFKSILEGGKVDIASRYEILREAVSGTMSNFHMARDRVTNQIVGLKILDKRKTDELEARFKGLDKPTEGEIAAKFIHPRIV